jgi:hypothetical protein
MSGRVTVPEGVSHMAGKSENRQVMHGRVVEHLVKETGISEEQARELVALLGMTNWTSLVREARLLNRRG